jgi:hypothetical protein
MSAAIAVLVSDHQGRGRRQHFPQGCLDERLGMDVQRGQRIIKDHQRPAADHRAGQRDPLALPARQGHAVLAEEGLRAVRKTLHEVSGLGDVQRPGQVRVASGLRAHQHVLGDAGGEQGRLVERDGHLSPQLAARHSRDVSLADRDPPAGRVIEPARQRGQRCLAAPGRPDQRDGLPGLDAQAHILEHRRRPRRGAGITELHGLEGERSRPRPGRDRAGSPGLLDRGLVQDLEEPAGRRRGLAAHGQQRAGRLHGRQQYEDQRDEREQRARRQAVTGYQHRTRRHAGTGRQDGQGRDQQRERREQPRLPQFRGPQQASLLREPLRPALALAEGLDDADAQHCLPDGRCQVAGLVLGQPGGQAIPGLEPGTRHHQRQQRRQRYQRELPLPAHQNGSTRREGHRVHHQERRGLGQEHADHLKIGASPRQHLAGLPAIVEAHRQPLHMPVQVLAHRRLDGSYRPGCQPAPDAENARLARTQQQQPQAAQPYPGRIAVTNRTVHHPPEHQRHRQPRHEAATARNAAAASRRHTGRT